MPNQQIVKRGYKGPMRRATKQVQKALALAEKRRKQAQNGLRKPKGKERAMLYPSSPNWEGRSTNSAQSSPRQPMLTTRDLQSALLPMSIPAAGLAGGSGANALVSGSLSNKRAPPGRNPNPGIFSDRSGPPAAPRMPPSQAQPSAGAGPNRTPNTLTIDAPVIIGVQKHGNHPRMWAKSRAGDVEVVVEHTEYVSDLVANSAGGFPGTNVLYQLFANPGQDNTFPWLSTLAQNFDEYKFDYLEITYEPTVGSATDGKMCATFDPDVLDDYPDTKAQMLEARVQLDIPVWTRGCLKVPKDLLAQWLFVRPGTTPAGADQHVYDCGVFNLALPGGSSSGTKGELFISYKVRLRTPNGGQVKEAKLSVVSPSLAAPMGTSISPTAQSNLSITWTGANAFRFNVPGIYYMIVADGGTTFAGTPTVVAPAGSATVLIDYNCTIPGTSVCAFIFNVTDVYNSYTMSAPSGAATLTSRSIRIFDHDVDNN